MFNNNTELELRDKLMILMLINDLKVPLTNEEITELVMDSGLINYISLQHYITELCELSMINRIPNENKYYYLITENGRVSLDFFKVRIPQHLQNKIDLIVKDYKKKLPVKTDIEADYKKIDEDNYEVSLNIYENNSSILNINVNVMSNKHAKLICAKWNDKASYLYGDIINILTQEDK